MHPRILLLILSLSIIFAKVPMRDITTMELCRDMGIGINLGNTFESYGDWIKETGDGSAKSYYTAWGSPEVTYGMIEGLYNEGFRVLRVPVHWFNLMDDDYNISDEYMEVVKKTVDNALEIGFYVILNLHHDERGLFKNMPTDKENSMKHYLKIWAQVADAFKDYDDYLMFESLNEEACWDDIYNRWGPEPERSEGQKKALALNSEINQQFVSFIRTTGGYNNKRHLLLAGYCTDTFETVNELFKLPYDPVNRFAVSIHYYIPSTFTILTEDADWGKASSTWGTAAELKELNTNLDLIKARFIDNGVPVIIGEYGVTNVNKELKSVHDYLYNVCKEVYDRKMVPVLWDGPGGLYNRTSYRFDDIVLRDMLNSVPEQK